MPSSKTYARRRISSYRIKRRLKTKNRRRMRVRAPLAIHVKRLKDIAFRACVWAFIVLVIFIAWRVFNPGIKIKATPETVAALRVPHRAVGILREAAARHDIPFAELFVLFCAENNFFPEKNIVYDLSGIEQQYVQDFHAIKKKYDAKNIAPYVQMFANIFDELASFPILADWEDEVEPSFMYGDSWQTAHPGMDILDRENIRGRIPVASMTDGIVQDAGYNDTWGYHIGITTQNGTYYLYAHLDSLAPGITAGSAVYAGQGLGRMGNSGDRKQGEVLPVHLHIGISPMGFTKNRQWLNPYPLLRYVENTPLF